MFFSRKIIDLLIAAQLFGTWQVRVAGFIWFLSSLITFLTIDSLKLCNIDSICFLYNVHTCVFECLSVKILSKYLETDAKTDEWLRVAIFPHFKITSQSGFCPFPSKLDLCCFKDASKASLKVIFSGASIWGRPSDLFTLHFWVLVFDDEAVDLVCPSGTVWRDSKKDGLNLAQRGRFGCNSYQGLRAFLCIITDITLWVCFFFALWCSSVIFHWSFLLENCKTFGHWNIYLLEFRYFWCYLSKTALIFLLFFYLQIYRVFL